MSLGEETQEYDSTGPDVYSARLVGEVEEGLWGHVSLRTRPVFDLHRLLQSADLLHVSIVLQSLVFGITVVVNLDLRQTEVN